jgi:mono/diheme cytochrome c family protein
MRWAAVMLVLLAAGCDDASMSHQPKRAGFSSEKVGPGPVPANTVEWRDRPQQAPPLTLALIQRGQDRFRSFCTPCHSELGDGNGMIVQRGFSPPPSYHIARLRQAPTQHFYEVMTHGYGAMYAFDYRVPPEDRWAIAAYIRALQRSTAGKPEDLSPEQRAVLSRQASR